MEVRDLNKVELHTCREDHDLIKFLLLELDQYLALKGASVEALLLLGEFFANVEIIGYWLN